MPQKQKSPQKIADFIIWKIFKIYFLTDFFEAFEGFAALPEFAL